MATYRAGGVVSQEPRDVLNPQALAVGALTCDESIDAHVNVNVNVDVGVLESRGRQDPLKQGPSQQEGDPP